MVSGTCYRKKQIIEKRSTKNHELSVYLLQLVFNRCYSQKNQILKNKYEFFLMYRYTQIFLPFQWVPPHRPVSFPDRAKRCWPHRKFSATFHRIGWRCRLWLYTAFDTLRKLKHESKLHGTRENLSPASAKLSRCFKVVLSTDVFRNRSKITVSCKKHMWISTNLLIKNKTTKIFTAPLVKSLIWPLGPRTTTLIRFRSLVKSSTFRISYSSSLSSWWLGIGNDFETYVKWTFHLQQLWRPFWEAWCGKRTSGFGHLEPKHLHLQVENNTINDEF